MLDKLMTPETRKLGEAFAAANFDIRFVGGCVRDVILGVAPKDVDFCTDARPEEMRDIAKSNNFGFIETGINHGTATIVVDKVPFEVTTLRIDTETDGRHATVEFTRSFEQDALRRDLTINAMSMDFQGNIYDYFGGQEDLENNLIRFVGKASERIQEDYLRILRYFRFCARFEAEVGGRTKDLFYANLEGLKKVSVERYWLEMQKLLMYKGAVQTLGDMDDCHVLEAIGLPLYLGRSYDWDLTKADDSISALATLFDCKYEAFKFADSWKLSRAEKDKLVWLVSNYKTVLNQTTIQDFLVDGVDRSWVVSWTRIRNAADYLTTLAIEYQAPVFPVTGKDLIEKGIKPGPEMGQMLAEMRDTWKAYRFSKTKEELLGSM